MWIAKPMDEQTPLEVIEFVVRSECRVDILELLAADGPVPKRELRDLVDGVRTTLQRNLDALAGRDLVQRTDDGYEITIVGRSIAEELGELRSVTARALEVGAVTRHLPESTLGIELDELEDPTVFEATTANPYLPVEKHRERLADAERARLVLPATAARSLETAESAIADGSYHEVVASADVTETLESELSDPFETMVASGTCDYYRYDGDVEFYLGVLDDVVQIGVHNDAGMPQALLESEANSLRTWAIERFESYRQESEPIA